MGPDRSSTSGANTKNGTIRTALCRNGNGNVAAGRESGFATDNGVQGQSRAKFKRNSDGTASAERATTITNDNTGVTLDGSSTYTKGEGVNRDVSCKDASGNSVTCGSAR